MYKTPAESAEFARALVKAIAPQADRDVLVCPPFTSLAPVADALAGSTVLLGAQNMGYEDEGPFTGEISAPMLKETGARYVILGHSERRNVFGENDELINKKMHKALSAGLIPILCVGEQLAEREDNRTFTVVERQLTGGLRNIAPNTGDIVIAYEPVWAIGTGRNASPEQAQEVHAFIRKQLKQDSRILYGGSVKPENVDTLMAQEDIDGALVGGASLKIDSFVRIINYK